MSLASASICTASSRVGAMISAFAGGGLGDQLPLENGDQEGGGLAGAGLRLDGHVLARSGRSARVFSWTGVSSVKPISWIPRSSRGSSCNCSKVIVFKILFSLI